MFLANAFLVIIRQQKLLGAFNSLISGWKGTLFYPKVFHSIDFIELNEALQAMW